KRELSNIFINEANLQGLEYFLTQIDRMGIHPKILSPGSFKEEFLSKHESPAIAPPSVPAPAEPEIRAHVTEPSKRMSFKPLAGCARIIEFVHRRMKPPDQETGFLMNLYRAARDHASLSFMSEVDIAAIDRTTEPLNFSITSYAIQGHRKNMEDAH